MNASGAQFNHTDMEEAVASLKQVINDMTEGGDIQDESNIDRRRKIPWKEG